LLASWRLQNWLARSFFGKHLTVKIVLLLGEHASATLLARLGVAAQLSR
jgi:hypothetical protein